MIVDTIIGQPSNMNVTDVAAQTNDCASTMNINIADKKQGIL